MINVSARTVGVSHTKVRAFKRDDNLRIVGKCGVIIPFGERLLLTALEMAEKFELPLVPEGTPYPIVLTLAELKSLTTKPHSEPLEGVSDASRS